MIDAIIDRTLVEINLTTTMGTVVRTGTILMIDIIEEMNLPVITSVIVWITEIVTIGRNMILVLLNTCTEIGAIVMFPMKKKPLCRLSMRETMHLIVIIRAK